MIVTDGRIWKVGRGLLVAAILAIPPAILTGCSTRTTESVTPAASVADARLPAAPTGVTVTMSGTTMTVAWEASTDPDVEAYRVWVGAREPVTLPPTTTSYVATGLGPQDISMAQVATVTKVGGQGPASLVSVAASNAANQSLTGSMPTSAATGAPAPPPTRRPATGKTAAHEPDPTTFRPKTSAPKTTSSLPTHAIGGTITIPYRVLSDSGQSCGGVNEFVGIQLYTPIRFTNSAGKQVGSGTVTGCRWKDAGGSFNMPGQPDYSYKQPIMNFEVAKLEQHPSYTVQVANLKMTVSWNTLKGKSYVLDMQASTSGTGLALTSPPFPKSCPPGFGMGTDGQCYPTPPE